jgi:hypothetical protein
MTPLTSRWHLLWRHRFHDDDPPVLLWAGCAPAASRASPAWRAVRAARAAGVGLSGPPGTLVLSLENSGTSITLQATALLHLLTSGYGRFCCKSPFALVINLAVQAIFA